MHRIGIDLGGTKVEGVVLDPEGTELARLRRPSPQRNYGQTVAAIAELVGALEALTEAGCSVGIGTPGAVSPRTGLMKNANSTWLNGKPLRRDLEQALGRAVRIENDANCFALSEAADGAGAGHRTVFGVILGTGVGGGIALEGRCLTGANAIGGEWGHNPLPWPGPDEMPGPACYCGKPGCLETWISGPGLAADHRRVTGQELTTAEMARLADQGDAESTASFGRYESRLARGLATVINILDPDAIVLGGGMSNVARLYRNLPPLLSKFCFSDGIDTPILPPKHGDSSGVRGAAWLWRPGEPPELM
jgi:fructokinase